MPYFIEKLTTKDGAHSIEWSFVILGLCALSFPKDRVINPVRAAARSPGEVDTLRLDMRVGRRAVSQWI